MHACQHFGGSTGYGHDDGGGRETLDNIFAEIVGAESAIIRSQVSYSGFCCLFLTWSLYVLMYLCIC